MNNKNLTTDSIVEEIIEEFNFFDDWEDKYAATVVNSTRNILKLKSIHFI